MNTSLTADQINMMNSILDRELDSLREVSYRDVSTRVSRIQNRSTASYLDSNYSNVINRPNKTDSFHKPPKDIPSYKHSGLYKTVDINETANKSLRMQEELLELQNKISEMERMVNQINSPAKNVSSASKRKRSPSKEDYRSKYQESEIGLTRKYQEGSPSKTQVPPQRKSSKNRNPPRLDNQSPKSDTKSPYSASTKQRRQRSSSYTPGKRFENLRLKEEIDREVVKLEHDKTYLRRTSPGRLSTGRSYRKESPTSVRRLSAKTYSGERQPVNEVHILNKKLSAMTKKYEEERKERERENLKVQELMRYNEKILGALKKMQLEVDKYKKLDKDYHKLSESFEKSEYIRNQQKVLISNLQAELEQYRTVENQDANETFQRDEKKLRQRSKKKRLSPAKKKGI